MSRRHRRIAYGSYVWLAAGLLISLLGGMLLTGGFGPALEALVPGHLASPPAGTPPQAETCADAASSANPVAAENLCPGTASWRLDHPTGPDHAIEGFTNPISVNAGGAVQLYVTTTARTYTFQVFRLGWYQGLGGRLIYTSARLPGIVQPPPVIDPATRAVSCANWRDPVPLHIPATWVSGVYVVKLLSSDGFMRYASFVVRQDASASPAIFYTAALTYQAYNLWGGYSLYFGHTGSVISPSETYSRTTRAYVVSFDRPYADNAGLGAFPPNEYSLLRWLERSGYNLSYATDMDVDQTSVPLLRHRLLLFGGHDEYWTSAMRNHVTTARDAGVSLAFFSADDIYWHARLQASALGPDREVVCYREAGLDPLLTTLPTSITTTWRKAPLNDSEDALLGQMYAGGVASVAPLVLASGATPFLKGTSLAPGAALPGLIGGEYDRVYSDTSSPASLVVLASSPIRCVNCDAGNGGSDIATATLYTAASGARVFDAGTFQWSWGLDDDSFDPHLPPRPYSSPAIQQFTANLLAYLLASPMR